MLKLSQKADCCGCGACAQACPKKCITMTPDPEGFLYPAVDADSCVNCGICEKVCPVLKNAKPESADVLAFAAYTPDAELRENSSSGGVFSVLAHEILRRDGVVFGAAFAEDLSVGHVMVEKSEQLSRLRGSKYVQSRIGDTYRQVKELLEQGRPVLFTGVSCQIAGLKAFLRKDYENLWTVDVLCHGVPSPAVWQQYCREQEAKRASKLERVCFRDKRTGWRSASIAMDFSGGEAYCQRNATDLYMRLFLSDICLRPSCHRCRFKDVPRLSDLTIGDAWGIEKHMPDMDDNRGTSVVLVNSEKGKALWETVAPALVSRQGEVDTLLPKTADSRKSVTPHPNRSKFFVALSQGATVEQLCKLTRRSWYRRLLSFGKRTIKRLLRK